jgi:hypothetical protein
MFLLCTKQWIQCEKEGFPESDFAPIIMAFIKSHARCMSATVEALLLPLLTCITTLSNGMVVKVDKRDMAMSAPSTLYTVIVQPSGAGKVGILYITHTYIIYYDVSGCIHLYTHLYIHPRLCNGFVQPSEKGTVRTRCSML